MIRIKRDSALNDSGRAYKVVLDGNVVGKVEVGQQIEVDASDGSHELFLKIDWCRSNKIEFESSSSGDVEFECGSNLRGWKLLFVYVYILFLPHKYIRLKQK